MSNTPKGLISEDINITLGNFNAKVGRGGVNKVTGKFELEIRNYKKEGIIQFCQGRDFAIMNTYFQLPSRRLYTHEDLQPKTFKKLSEIKYIILS